MLPLKKDGFYIQSVLKYSEKRLLKLLDIVYCLSLQIGCFGKYLAFSSQIYETNGETKQMEYAKIEIWAHHSVNLMNI